MLWLCNTTLLGYNGTGNSLDNQYLFLSQQGDGSWAASQEIGPNGINIT